MVPMLMGTAIKMLKTSETKKEVNKKIAATKFISRPKESEKKGSAITKVESKPSSIVKYKSISAPIIISPSPTKISKPKEKVDFSYLNSLLNSLVKNTSSLLKISKNNYKRETKGAEEDRRSDQLETKRTREEKSEDIKSERSGFGIKLPSPKLSMFGGALEFLKKIAVGSAVMQILSIFSDPKKKDSIIGFLTNNFEAIILGMVGVMGALLLAPLTPVLTAFGILFNVTAALVGSLVSLLISPVVLPVLGVALATAGVVAATQTPAGQNSQISGPNAVWKDPRLNPRSRKAIIESTFEHMPYNTWPQDAKNMYEKALRDLKISLKNAQDNLRKKVKKNAQQRNQILQNQQQKPKVPTFTFPQIFSQLGYGTPSQPEPQPQSPLVPQSSLPPLPPTGTGGPQLAAAQQYGAARRGGRRHAGVDFDAGPNDTFYSRIGGEVTHIGYDPSGYFKYVDIYNSDLGVTERVAEGDNILVKRGEKVSPGTPVARGTNTTGVFHYEIRKGKGTTFGFTGTLNPLEFLKGVQTSNIAKVQPKPPSAKTTSAVSQYASYEEPKREAALVPIPISSAPQQQTGSGGGSPMVVRSQDPFQVLNTYYKFQVLGFLYKQG